MSDVTAEPSRIRDADASIGDSDALADVAAILARCEYVCRIHAGECLDAPEVAELVDCIRAALDGATLCDAVGTLLAHRRRQGSPQLAPALELCARACEDAVRICTDHGHDPGRRYIDSCRSAADACRRAAMSLVPGVSGALS